MLVVLVSGPRGPERASVAGALVRALSSRGYRVGAASRAASESAVRERPDTEAGLLENSGASLVALVGRRRSRVTVVTAPKSLEDLLRLLEAGQRVPPDAVVLSGFDRLAGRREDVLKVVVAHGPREAQAILRGLADPVVAAVCAAEVRGPLRSSSGGEVPVFPLEGEDQVGRLVVETAKRLKLIH